MRVKAGRAFEVGASVDAVRERLNVFANMYDFRLSQDQGTVLQYKRGGFWGNLLSFDVNKVTSTLEIRLNASQGRCAVQAQMLVGSALQIGTSGDRAALEQQMDVLVSMVKASG
jgi:hypothetical protein